MVWRSLPAHRVRPPAIKCWRENRENTLDDGGHVSCEASLRTVGAELGGGGDSGAKHSVRRFQFGTGRQLGMSVTLACFVFIID